jgi:hypothetical protein
MGDKEFDVFCVKCNVVVVAREIASGVGRMRSDAVAPDDVPDAEYRNDYYVVALCPRCESPFLMRQSLYGIPAEFEVVTESVQLYPQSGRLPLGDLVPSVARAYEQAERSFVTGLYEPAALMCRRCLEAVCKTLGATGRTLDARLDRLASDGHIDERLRVWAHSVRVVGNEAAHDVEVEMSKDDARDVLDFTEALLLYVFSLKRRHEAFIARRSMNEPT